MKKIALSLIGLLTALPAFGLSHACEYEVFTAANLQREILARLPELGVSALPPALSPVSFGGDSAPGKLALLRDESLIGELRFQENSRRGLFQLLILDSAGRTLLSVTETHVACPGGNAAGPCHRIDLATELEPPLGGVMPYSVIAEGPLNATIPHYLKYGRYIGRYDFTLGLKEALLWLDNALRNAQSVLPLKALTPFERVKLRLAADPYIAPYLGRIEVLEYRGELVLRGVVPSNFVYGRVIDHFHSLGLWGIRPHLIIDTRLQLAPAYFPELMRCFRR
jgi:hypothetical protein